VWRIITMTIFENTLINLIHNKCIGKDWWIFSDADELKSYWESNSFRVDPNCRYFAVSVNERELNVIGFDALSECHNIDIESVLISAHILEKHYEELYFG